ncbi:hypothetical protein D0N87_34845, partial [Pseudomonas sp. ATCC 13867]
LLAILIGLALLGLHESLQRDRLQSACRPDGNGISCSYPPTCPFRRIDQSVLSDVLTRVNAPQETRVHGLPRSKLAHCPGLAI